MDYETDKFFGEHAYFKWDDPEERKDAENYLKLWKKFLIQKVKKEVFEVNITEETWVSREPQYICCIAEYGSLALKLCLRVKFKYEL